MQQWNLCNILCTLHGARARFSSEEICNEYAAQTRFCQSQAFPTEKIQILSDFVDFQKKPSALKNSRISKSGFKKVKLATLLHVQRSEQWMVTLYAQASNTFITS